MADFLKLKIRITNLYYSCIFIVLGVILIQNPALGTSCVPIQESRYSAHDIVEMADTIVLSQIVGNEIINGEEQVVIKPIDPLKGSLSNDTVVIPGLFRYQAHPDTGTKSIYPETSLPYNNHPNPKSTLMGCRISYHKKYHLYDHHLFFFHKGTIYFDQVEATNVQVTGPNDPWVMWVRQALESDKTNE